MHAEKYKTRSGVTQYHLVMNEEEVYLTLTENDGFCLACGEEVFGVEPDAIPASPVTRPRSTATPSYS